MTAPSEARPVLVAVGGGKGGVGKSVLSLLTGHWLALLGKRTVVVDLDLSGANVHTLLGIRNIPFTLGDLLSRRADTLERIALQTANPNLRIVCGASDHLGLANPFFAQKIKIMQKLISLDADYVVMDLGAGTSFDVLDFFLVADVQIAVTTAEPIAVYNAYGFLRNAVFRRVSQLTRRNGELHALVAEAMDPHNRYDLRTLQDLLQALEQFGHPTILEQIERALARIEPGVVVNRVRDGRDRNTAGVIRDVARKYLRMEVADLGGVLHDRRLERMVAGMQPLTDLREGDAYESTYRIASALVQRGLAAPGAQAPPHRLPFSATG